jgi:hypothetical protein
MHRAWNAIAAGLRAILATSQRGHMEAAMVDLRVLMIGAEKLTSEKL